MPARERLRGALVNMPFGSMMRPSLALGLLKAQPAQRGIVVQGFDFTRSFAEVIGTSAYLYISDQSPPTELAGDWVFAGCLFGEDRARRDAYLAHVGKGRDASDVPSMARSHAKT